MRRLSLVAPLLLLLAGAPALAQFVANPFLDQAESLRHAFALEMMQARLAAIEALAEAPADSVEGVGIDTGEVVSSLAGDLLEEDLALFAGSLEAAQPDLLADLQTALEDLEQAAGAGALEAAESAVPVRTLLVGVGETLVGDATSDPAFVAALISQLLLSEEGVAEGYEEAVAEDPGAFPLGWAALQRVEELWPLLATSVAPEFAGEVEEALSELDQLFPAVVPGAALSGDPEDAEEPSHRIVALLERASDARLYPDRDLAGLAGQVRELAGQGCEDSEAGRALLGRERLRAAQTSYEYLADLAGLLAPEPHAGVEEAFEALGEADVEAGSACGELLEALDAIRSVTGG
jgi:hypothetical protein